VDARPDPASSDIELLARAEQGEADAFGVLFERHGPAVLQFCFRRTADAALAEDLTSIVFLEAWRKRGRLQLFQESARPWLLGVALNVVRSQYRTQRRHSDALARLRAPAPAEPESDRAIARIDAEREMRVVLDTVSKLNRREREVLELCVWAELSPEEAASSLGISVGAVRSRLSRARRRLAVLAPAVQSSAANA
jgi:RNA polymerase sigma-70 factor (ECF subfamily)